jgi:hypothetical protein
MKGKTPAEIADKIYERISEDGWFLHPRVDVNNPGGFALVPPESDKRRCFAARWTTIKISVPSYLFDDEGPIGL